MGDFTAEFDTDSPVLTEELIARVQYLEEGWDEAAGAMARLRAEDRGWLPFKDVGLEDKGFSLDAIKEIAEVSELQAIGNPLLKRGFHLRYDAVFSRGFRIEGDVKPRIQRKLDVPSVKSTLFTTEGWEANERCLYITGNFFVRYNRLTGELYRISLDEITGRAHNPEDTSVAAYYQRTYTRYEFDGTSEPVTEWYPVLEWVEAGLDAVDKIGQHTVNHDWVVIDLRVNKPTVGVWGVPDMFAAAPYAWGYGEYIRDASSLLKALTTIAWKVVGRGKSQAQTAGVKLSGPRRAGQTAVMTEGTDIQAMPRSGQVNMKEGEAIAAMVASALEVPLPALLSNPGIGSYGSVAALDGPTANMARARQRLWTAFYERVFRAMGAKDVTLNFPKTTEDPVHRQVSSLATGRATGAIWGDEYRMAFLEATDVTPLHDHGPDVSEYAQAQNALGFLQMVHNLAGDDVQADPLARQGNSGVSGTLGEIDNTNRDLDTKPGTGSMTGLTG